MTTATKTARKEHFNTRAFITFEGAAALLTVEDTAEYQAKAEAINAKYDAGLKATYFAKTFEEDAEAGAEYDALLKAKGAAQDTLAEDTVANALAGIGGA